MRLTHQLSIAGFIVFFGFRGSCHAELPPVPVPEENPITEAKRVLGKMLFWDEQLSSDNTVACGSCHRPAFGGADPREGRHPGTDPGTIDDTRGSPGIARLDADGNPVEDPIFGYQRQVTRRIALSNFGSLWAGEVFWDGRAGSEFTDPLTGEIVIRKGGALENQALEALANDAEMAKTDRAWVELMTKLERERPLALAVDLPADVSANLATTPDYPALFAAAFGDPAITPVRIAFALASYQRTLIADQTPWDRFRAGDSSALSAQAQYGWRSFQELRCANCHVPPVFSNNDFFNIGLRRIEYDPGRADVTGNAEDGGEMKVPTLRNAALRARFMHTGEFSNLGAAIGFYTTPSALQGRDEIPGAGAYSFSLSAVIQYDLLSFLLSLTDPRVEQETFPFDRPTLRSERAQEDGRAPAAPLDFEMVGEAGALWLSWTAPADDTGVVDYVLRRNGRVIALSTGTSYLDEAVAREASVSYSLVARDAAANESPPTILDVRP